MGGFVSHPGAELRTDADVLGRDVGARHGLDEATHGSRLGLGRFLTRGIQQDHAFRAAHGKICGRRLVSHAFREAEHIHDPVGFAGVAPASGTSECVAECRVVDRDHGAEAALWILMERHTFVAHDGHVLKELHRVVISRMKKQGRKEFEPRRFTTWFRRE